MLLNVDGISSGRQKCLGPEIFKLSTPFGMNDF